MKPVSNFLHKMPWWALIGGGFVLLIGLGIFTTPFHLLRLDKSGATPEENRAIKREIDSAFSEGAVDIAHNIVREMRDHTKDAQRRAELDRALSEIEDARSSMREAGAEALRAKREAAEETAGAMREATRQIEQAQRQAEQAMRDAGVQADSKLKSSLDESLKAAREAQAEAKRAADELRRQQREKAAAAREKARQAHRDTRSAIEDNAGDMPVPPEPPHVPRLDPNMVPNVNITPAPGSSVPSVTITPPTSEGSGPVVRIGPPDAPAVAIDSNGNVAITPLPPELKKDIRRKVTGDLYRAGLGAGLILLFIPLFVLLVVSKFFIDRARGAQRVAEAKRKEAEYARMSQQVTEAKLSALQAQVEPHFLYNTLASVQALTEVDPQKANAMTGHLIQYLRNALPKMRESVSTVGQEIELVRAYLNILQMRMGKRLAFDIDVPQELMELPFPPLMLPSLVENAIKHGLEPQREGGKVTIGASCVDGILRVVVADTGRGFGESVGSGVGLANIRERLAALYGDLGKLTLEANQPQGVVATIEVPREGARPQPAAFAASGADEAVPPPKPQTATAKTLAAMATAERAWRKGLSFTFVVLVVIAAVLAGLAMVGFATGLFPVQVGHETVGGATGALIGTAGIAAAFAVVVLCLAIVLAVVYGLGFLFVGLAIFIPLVVIVSVFPALAPFILVGLGVWWLVRRSKRKAAAAATVEAQPAEPEPAKP